MADLYKLSIKALCVLLICFSFVVLPQRILADTVQTSSDSVPHASTRLGVVEDRVTVGSSALGMRKLTTFEKGQYPQKTNIPTLYIRLDKNLQVRHISKERWIGAVYTLVDGDMGIVDKPMEIKGRGNYSWTMSKKPYAVKLSEKADLLGMGASRKWVLIANWSDKSLTRNYSTMQLARHIGMEYASDCQYVDVYFNGKYHGNYLLTEKITIGKNRIDLDPENEDEGLFEIEMTYRHSDCTWCISCPSGVHITYKEPDADEYGIKWKQEQLKKFKLLYIKADAGITKLGYEYYSRYIDVDSFVDWYIVNEFVKNYDSGFTTSCYSYVKDGKIYMGPVWDYDTCMGNQDVATCLNYEGYHVGTSPWYAALLKDEDFFRILCERWTYLEESGGIDGFFDRMKESHEYIADSAVENFKVWRDAERFNGLRGKDHTKSHEEEFAYVNRWMGKRREWLDEKWSAATDSTP